MRDETVRSLLLIDADAQERRLIGASATRVGWTVIGAADAETAVGLLQGPHGREVRAAILSTWSEGEGQATLKALLRCNPDLPVIVLADGGSIAPAVDAIRAGAADYLAKPVAADRLHEALRVHADRRRLGGELAPLSEKLNRPLELDELIGSAPEFRAVQAIAAKTARSRNPILIQGEPGTGKQTFAEAIHGASLRAKGPLVRLDCKSLPANIVDSELFGHVPGAFPGAFDEKVGKMVASSGGTIIIEEIADLPPQTQEQLDRVLATGEVRPVGCNGSNSVDVRLIATSSRPLGEDFHAGLAERLGQVSVTIPPLRDRSTDIPALARHLLQRLSGQADLGKVSLDEDALKLLMRYGWPGNVRQLATVLFRAALASNGGALGEDDFPHIAVQARYRGRRSDIVPFVGAKSAKNAVAGTAQVELYDHEGHLRPLEDIESDIIRLAIGHYGGRMTEVARRLKIGRSTLYRKLGDLGIDTAA